MELHLALLWMAQQPTQTPWTIMGLSSGALSVCRLHELRPAAGHRVLPKSPPGAGASTMPKPSQPSPHPQLCSKISSRSKTDQGQILWTLSQLRARAGLPMRSDPTHWPWVGGLQGLRRGSSAQPGPGWAQQEPCCSTAHREDGDAPGKPPCLSKI